MTKLQYKLTTGIATATLIAAAFAPAAFAADITVAGNGDSSTQTVNDVHANVTVVGQSSVTSVSNVVTTTANTGGNSASRNTGGSSDVTTGNAVNNVTITTVGGDNTATVEPCDCDDPANTITVRGNGNKSMTTVNDFGLHLALVGQNSQTQVGNVVTTKAKTGNNKANKNTGKGSKSVTTGNARNTVSIRTVGGSNSLN